MKYVENGQGKVVLLVQIEHLKKMVTLPFECFTDNAQHHSNRHTEVKNLLVQAEGPDGPIVYLQQMYCVIDEELSVVRVRNLYLIIHIFLIIS